MESTEREAEGTDVEIVWWLVRMGREDRDLYRRLRALGWRLAVDNYDSSAKPKKLS